MVTSITLLHFCHFWVVQALRNCRRVSWPEGTGHDISHHPQPLSCAGHTHTYHILNVNKIMPACRPRVPGRSCVAEENWACLRWALQPRGAINYRLVGNRTESGKFTFRWAERECSESCMADSGQHATVTDTSLLLFLCGSLGVWKKNLLLRKSEWGFSPTTSRQCWWLTAVLTSWAV